MEDDVEDVLNPGLGTPAAFREATAEHGPAHQHAHHVEGPLGGHGPDAVLRRRAAGELLPRAQGGVAMREPGASHTGALYQHYVRASSPA